MMDIFSYLPALGLSQGQLEAFSLYRDMLLDWNAGFNLTAITDPKEVEVKHFVDSLLLERCGLWRVAFADAGAGAKVSAADVGGRVAGAGAKVRVADVGGGAGFPGVPLRMLREDIALDIMEATGKKVQFLQALAEALQLGNMRAIHIRAEEAGQNPDHRGTYDWALARGVAAMPALLEYCLPPLKVGGFMAAYKGPARPEEAEAAQKAAAVLGGGLAEICRASLPEGQGERTIIIYRKLTPTPRQYPRKPGTPTRQPL
jgi:16S rRNA (guanine527-N7)-methyltransferase